MDMAREKVCGFWSSDNGQCHIFLDKITHQLSYEELIGDGSERLHGRLEAEAGDNAETSTFSWQASLAILEQGQDPWYGPSCGPKPEELGKIKVTLRPASDSTEATLETRIKSDDDEDWQE